MKFFALLFYGLVVTFNALAADTTLIKIGVQSTGTLAWELAVLQNNAQFKNNIYRIETQELATPEAGKIALQSGSVDMVVTDWIWTSRMRADGVDFTFYPYFANSGALMVANASSIKSIKDLADKHIGIAGGELDKNWLLLQALGKQQQLDLNAVVDKVYAAPPLLDEQLKLGRLDAVLDYWHFAAKLEAQGYRQVINGKQILTALGIQEQVPILGYVFKQSWAEHNKAAVSAFFKATKAAKQLLCHDDSTWQKIIPLLQTDDLNVQKKMRTGYCDGSVTDWTQAQHNAAEKIYGLLRQLSNNQLTGSAEHIQPGTFWVTD